MITTAYKFPAFDLTEIVSEPTYQLKTFKPLRPLATGDAAPNFHLLKEKGKWKKSFSSIFKGSAVSSPKPLVTVFYSGAWKEFGKETLQQLQEVEKEINALGAELLVITSDTKHEIEKLIWQNGINLNYYFDQSNAIASRFEIFSEQDPAWDRFSGVEKNIPLLSIFAVSAQGIIIYNHVERAFNSTFSSQKLLSALATA